MRTLRLIKRLLTELPQPARRFEWLLWITFITGFVLGIATRTFSIAAAGAAVAGVFAFLFGRCIFRDINGAATFWSTAYKESRGLAPEHFTFFDVPTAKAMGFFYMLMGVFWVGGSIVGIFNAFPS